MSSLSAPRIVCAANRHPETNEIAVGVRHFCPIMRQNISGFCAERNVEMMDMKNTYASQWRVSEQGFIDQHGKFYSRKAAWLVADANRQIFRDRDWCAGSLHSEHLY